VLSSLTLAVLSWATPPAPKLSLALSVSSDPAGTLCYPSGLQVRVAQRQGDGLAAVSMVLEGGTALETDATRSAAHMVEHLWFRSAEEGGLSLWQRQAGLALDATTRTDVTTYTTVGSAGDLEGLLAEEARRLADPLQGITEDDLASEKRIVAGELGLRGEHGSRIALQQLDALLFPAGHPYHRPLATSADVEALSLDSLRSYAEAAYRPANASLSIVADVPLEEQQSLVEAALAPHLGGDATSCDRPPAAQVPATPDTRTRTVQGAVWQQRVYAAWALPPGWSGHDAVARAALANLEALVRGRLAFTRGLTGDARAAVGCEYLPGRVASTGVCRVVLPDGVAAEPVVKAMTSALSDQRSTSQMDSMFRSRRVASTTAAALRSVLGAADSWHPSDLVDHALAQHRGTGAPTVAALDEVFTVDEPGVRTYASEWLTEERIATLIMQPSPGEGVAVGDVPTITALPTPAAPGWSPAPPLPTARAEALDNGLTVWTAAHPRALSATSGLVTGAGWGHGPEGSQTVYDLLVRYRTPVSFSDLSLQLGMRTWTRERPHYALTANRGAWGNLDMSLWMQRNLIDNAVIELSERQGAIDDRLEWTPQLARWPDLHVDRLHRRHLYGAHRLGTTYWDRLASARKLKVKDATTWQRAMVRPDADTLVVVGTDANAALQSAERYLGGWKERPASMDDPVPPPPTPPEARAMHSMRWNSLFAQVRVACRLAPAGPEVHDVTANAIRHALWGPLREGAGAYAPQVWLEDMGDGEQLLHAEVALRPGQGPSGVAAILDTLALAEQGVPPELLSWAQRERRGQLARRLHSSATHFEALVDAAAAGRPVDALADSYTAIDAVTPADVTAALAPCVGGESVVLIAPEAEALQGATPYDYQAEGAAWSEALTQ